MEKFGPNTTQPNTTNNGAYNLVVTNFYTQNLSVSGTCLIGRKIKLTAWCKQILSNRASNALTQSFQFFSTFAVVDTTPKLKKSRPNPTHGPWVNPTHGQHCRSTTMWIGAGLLRVSGHGDAGKLERRLL